MRVVFEQFRSGFVRFGSDDHVCGHDVLDICHSLRRCAFGLPQWTSPIDDGGRISHPPLRPSLYARSFPGLAGCLLQLVPPRLLERGLGADVDGQEVFHAFRLAALVYVLI